MKALFRRAFRFATPLLTATLALLVAVLIVAAQQPKPTTQHDAAHVASQSAASNPNHEKLAEDVYKNIKSLKGQPASQLIPTMQFMASSLGVTCEFCHDMKAFEKDTKDEKRTAREMIAMQQGINRGHFNGHREVTCNTCHHGEMHPAAIPALAELNAAIPEPIHEHEHEHGHHMQQLSSPTEYLDAYLQAAGGEAALAKLTSLTQRGTVSLGEGPEVSFENYTRANGERATSLALKDGTATSVFNGHTGFLAYPGRHSRQMSTGVAEATRVEADILFPVNFKHRYTQFRTGHPETVNGKPANLLIASRTGEPPVRLYFDPSSKLLLRVVYYVETPLGRLPTQLDITSYTATDGLQLPSRWIVTEPDSRATYTVQSSSTSPIDDAKFAPPAPTEAAAH